MSRTVHSNMGSRLLHLAPLATLLAVAACSSVLGIEDLHEGPAPDSGGSDSAGGDSGSGGALVGPSGGATTMPGGGSGGGGSGNAGSGGKAFGGSSGKGGDTSIGMAGGPDTGGGGAGSVNSPVHGHVIDYWGHKLAGVPVEIAGTLVTTDALGGFTIDDVAPQYDASLVAQFADNYSGEVFGWVYQGLTRRDPTLQVYAGLKEQSGNLDVAFTHADVTLTGTRTMTLALGGTDGSGEHTDASGGGYDGLSVDWRGPDTAAQTAHALIWQPNSSGLPTGYVAYDNKPVTLDGLSSMHSAVTLDMSAETIASGNIVGTVTPAGGQTRANSVFLQFTSNAVIQLVQDQGPNSFSYLVPTITNSSITFAASEAASNLGTADDGAYSIVHKDALAAGTSGITAVIPKPATLLTVTPAASKTKVDSTTQFAFEPGAGAAGLFVIAFRQPNSNFLKTDGLFIVTTKKTFTLPKVAKDTFALDPGASYYWRVETHGSVATMDAAAGPTGYLDSFSGDYYGQVPLGPRRGDGAYTISGYSDQITMAP